MGSRCSQSLVLLARSSALCLALIPLLCGVTHAQHARDVAPQMTVPLWMPRPSRFPDRPMTQAELNACRRRTDLPKLGPHPHAPNETPPAPRYLLEDVVSAEVNGTVVDAVKALVADWDGEWLVGIRDDSADEVAPFTAKDLPLWQALDLLLETYGYDWGLAHGAIVCRPALIPARERPVPPEAVPQEEAALTPSTSPLDITEPTGAEEVLARFHPTTGALDWRVALDARLRDWKLVGRISGEDAARGIRQVAAALTATIEGAPTEGAVCMGAHMWLDRAMRGAEARAAELKARGISLEGMSRTHPLQDSLRALITPQQWRLMELGGQAVIRFRELPLEVAELWVLTAQEGQRLWERLQVPPEVDLTLDWSRPEDFFVMALFCGDIQQSPADGLYRVVGWHLSVSAVVVGNSGVWRDI